MTELECSFKLLLLWILLSNVYNRDNKDSLNALCGKYVELANTMLAHRRILINVDKNGGDIQQLKFTLRLLSLEGWTIFYQEELREYHFR